MTPDELIKDFEKRFCTTVGDGEVTVVRWINNVSTPEENAAQTKEITKWLRDIAEKLQTSPNRVVQ